MEGAERQQFGGLRLATLLAVVVVLSSLSMNTFADNVIG